MWIVRSIGNPASRCDADNFFMYKTQCQPISELALSVSDENDRLHLENRLEKLLHFLPGALVSFFVIGDRHTELLSQSSRIGI